jgi:hypothetical protein
MCYPIRKGLLCLGIRPPVGLVIVAIIEAGVFESIFRPFVEVRCGICVLWHSDLTHVLERRIMSLPVDVDMIERERTTENSNKNRSSSSWSYCRRNCCSSWGDGLGRPANESSPDGGGFLKDSGETKLPMAGSNEEDIGCRRAKSRNETFREFMI